MILPSDSSPASAASRPPATLRTFFTSPPLWAALVACVLLLAARRPDAFSTPQLWAEDGIFFHQAYQLGFRSLFEELAGYFHLVPRLAGLAAASVDPLWVPHVFVGTALLGTLYVAARLCSARCPLPLPGACVLALPLVPDAGEVLLTTTNIQWVLAGALVLLLLSAEAKTLAGKTHDVLAAFIMGLTGPFSIALAPLFLYRAWVRRTGLSYLIAAVIIACGAIQLVSIIRHPLPLPPDPKIDAAALTTVSGIRVGASLLLGSFIPSPFPFFLATAFTGLTFGALAFFSLRSGPGRRERIWLALAACALLASALTRYRYILPALCVPGNGSRYFFTVQLAVLWLFFSYPIMARATTWTIAAVALLMLAVNVRRLREGPFENFHWENYAARIRAGEAVTIPINPHGWPIDLPARPPKGR